MNSQKNNDSKIIEFFDKLEDGLFDVNEYENLKNLEDFNSNAQLIHAIKKAEYQGLKSKIQKWDDEEPKKGKGIIRFLIPLAIAASLVLLIPFGLKQFNNNHLLLVEVETVNTGLQKFSNPRSPESKHTVEIEQRVAKEISFTKMTDNSIILNVHEIDENVKLQIHKGFNTEKYVIVHKGTQYELVNYSSLGSEETGELGKIGIQQQLKF